MKWKKRFRLAALTTACWLVTTMSLLFGQVNTGGPNTTNDHSKQVIGYITEWDAWKATNAGLPAQGALTQLNIDYSKYTILNYSFFGVAQDGSLHSGDLRNKNIYMESEVQQPGDIFYTDIYSSWDLYILFGELEIVQYISQDVATRAQAQGFDVEVNGTTWSNPTWGLYDKALPLPLKKEGGAGGLLDLAHQNGVKVMASIGGWSMCKHYPEMAADPVKRARFVEDCKKLINIGFDGIDLDWEYPGFGGMNFIGTQADFANFTTLVQEIRAAIGSDKLLTAAMSAAPAKLDGFEWSKLVQTMDYFNMMTYDFNGGWSDIAGHNAPLYAYDGAEAPTFNWNSTYQKLVSLGVPTNMVNMGCPFYGRGVVCQNTAELNATTQKTSVTIQPDGPITTCADYTNWPLDVYDGTPNYFYIKQKTGLGTTNGWTRHWDDQAKVPYLTNGKYFLSYDDEESIGLKAQYILDNQLAGTIIWTVFGDLEISGTVTTFGTKLKRWSNVKSTLVNKINEVFATGGTCTPDNITSYITINDETLQQTTNVTIDAGSKVAVSPQPETGTWSWTGPNGFSSSTREFTLSNIQTSSAGTYIGTLVNAAGCTSSVSVTIGVNDGNDPEDGLRIVGYIPSWKGDATTVQYDKLTHIIYAFVIPSSSGDGSLNAVPNVSKLQQIVELAHAEGVKVSIAVGGWSDLNNPGFEGLSSTAAGRENFANSLLALCNQYNLDGVDIDWEYPIGYTSNFASMMQTLATTLHANGKILSAAVPGGDYYGQYVNLDALNALDFLNIMAYDGDSGAGHSPYSFAVSALNYWTGKGMANDKAVLGVPFYSRPSSTSFADLLAQGASADEDYYNGEYYNGIPTIKQKSELAKSYGGIMIWELTHDASGENSLLSAIYEVIYGSTTALTANAGGSYSGQVNAAITFSGTASGGTSPYSYSWNFGDGSTGTGNSTSHTYTTAGNYTVTLTVSDAAGETATNTAPATINESGDDGNTCWTEWVEGAYNGGAQVSYNGVNYQAKWWTNGVPGVDDTWENMGTCDGSGTGDETGTCWAEWVEGAYNGGAQVSYNGVNYQAKWWTNGVPGVDDTWENMGTCDGSGTGDETGSCWTEWVEGAYNGGAQVSYNGVNYQAKWWTNGVPGVDDTWENMGTCGNSGSGLVISAGNSYSGTAGVAVSFTGSASGGTSPYTYAWNFGDGTTGSGSNPAHAYSSAGTYTATFTVTDASSSTATSQATVSITDGTVTIPIAPSSLTATSVSSSQVNLNWTDNSDNETIFSIQRSTDGSSWSGLNTVNANTTAYSNTGLDASTIYYYRVAAQNSAGASSYSNVASATTQDNNSGGELSNRIMSGYWHTWNAGVPFIKLRDVDSHWDVINIAFAEPVSPGSSDGSMKFEISGLTADYTINDFKTDVKNLQSQGKKIVLSIGGYEGYFSLGSSAAVTNFVTVIKGFIDEYGFDGIDIDLEQYSLEFNSGADPDFTNPVSPKVVYFIQALQQITNAYGSDFILSFAPETFYFQMGHTYYGGLNGYVDTRSGVYIPIIYALRDKVTYVQAQLYNSGSIQGLDGNWYDMGTVAGIVEMCEMAIEGFTLNGNASYVFPGLRPDQVVIGVPCSQGAAGSGQIANTNLQQAFTTLVQQYPGLRGFMTWSINWDAFQNNNSFAIENRTFLDGYKNAKALPSAPEQTSTDITLYPNPVENTLMINGISGISHINIYDMIGQKVIEATTQPVDVSGLKTGTYILKVSSENNNTQKIFIKN